MQFLKNFLGIEDTSVIGLSELRKKKEYVSLTIPEGYKNTYMPDTRYNFILS